MMTLLEALAEAVKQAGVRWPPCRVCGKGYDSSHHREVCKHEAPRPHRQKRPATVAAIRRGR
jgi:hypothetical protein